METSKLDGPVETCHAQIGIGVPGAARGGARERQSSSGPTAPVVHIEPAKYIHQAIVRQLALQTCRTLLIGHTKSLQGAMGLGTADMASVLAEVLAAVRDAGARTEAPPG